jgi:hypothetical protein
VVVSSSAQLKGLWEWSLDDTHVNLVSAFSYVICRWWQA